MTVGTYNYGGKVFHVPVMSGKGGFRLKPSPRATLRLRGPEVDAITKVWDYRRFEQPNHAIQTPIHVEPAVLETRRDIRVLDVPVKMAGSVDDYRVPEELAPFRKLIQDIIDVEHATFPPEVIKKFHAYVTIHQKQLEVGEVMRSPGAHVDGFQGSRVHPKVALNHSYIVSNLIPTQLHDHPFKVSHLNPVFHNFFKDFDRQIKLINTPPVFTEAFKAYMLNAFKVHEGIKADKEGLRTFFRMSYDITKFDRLGNTITKEFDYNWKFVPRFAHDSLVEYAELPQELRHAVNSASLEQIAEKAKGMMDRKLYQNFLYESSRVSNDKVLGWVVKKVIPEIGTDISMARLAYTIVLQNREKSLRRILDRVVESKKANYLYKDLRDEMINRLEI
jgi:hypothetical protein